MKSKKSALLLSFTSLLICFAMLVGSTFAWFTDTATTGVNQIVSGNLKVDIIGETGEDHLDALKFTKADATTDTGAEAQILWEPGCRYLTQGFRIANKGNLALKWKAQVNKGTTATNDGGYDLLDVIDFYLVKNDINDEGTPLDEFTGNLTAGAKTSDVYYIKGVMDKDAGNNYQNLTLDGITITVYATQDTVEYDSFDDQYDKDAPFPTPVDATVTSAEDIKAAMEKGKAAGAPVKVTLSQDVSGVDLNGGNVTVDVADKKLTLENSVISEGEVTINGNAESKLGNAKVTVEGAGKLTMGIGLTGANAYQWGSFTVKDGGTLNVTGGTNTNEGFQGKLITATGENTTVNISGGTFESSGSQFKSVEAQNGAVVNVTGGTFSSSGAKSVVFYADGGTIIISDCKVWVNGNIFQTENDGQIVVTGGTFSQNPSAYVDLNNYNVTETGSYYTVTAK